MLTKFFHSDDPEQTVINLASQYPCEVGKYYQPYFIGGETGAHTSEITCSKSGYRIQVSDSHLLLISHQITLPQEKN